MHDYFMVYNSYILHTVCKIHFPPRMSKKSTCIVSTTRIADALSRQSIARRAAPMRPQPSVKPFCFDRNKVGTPNFLLKNVKIWKYQQFFVTLQRSFFTINKI